jgi:hypothetical protein
MKDKAAAIARAIIDEDSGAYLVAIRDADMGSMKRGELIRFRDLVHDLVDELDGGKKISVMQHNQE